MDQKQYKLAIRGLFSLYAFFLLGNLLIFRLIHFLRVGFNSYYYNDDGFKEGYVNIDTLIQNANIIPFKTIWLFVVHYQEQYFNFYTLFYNILLNIVAFIPLGVFLPIIFNGTKSLHKFLTVTSLSFLIIEILQLLLHLGQFDIDDVILNSLGAMLGYYFFRFLIRKKWLEPVWK